MSMQVENNHFKESKAFFFEKKKQKTFAAPLLNRLGFSGKSRLLQMRKTKVFCFFFSKKKAFLASPYSHPLRQNSASGTTMLSAIRQRAYGYP